MERTPSPTLAGTPRETMVCVDEDHDAELGRVGAPTGKRESKAGDHPGDIEKSRPVSPSSDFEVRFTGDDDPRNPRSMSLARKWFIILVISASSFYVACVSSIYAETYGQITVEFNCSELVATLGLSFFVFGLGLGPMALGPMSEFYGRKPIYVISLAFFLIWIIPCAVARNIETIIVVRFFDGIAGSVFLSVAGSTVGDLFSKETLAAPMAIYTLSPFLGPIMGPLVGGFVNYFLNWRWTFWIILIWGFINLLLVALFVPETYHPVVLRNEARRLRKNTGSDRYYAPIEVLDKSVAWTVVRSCYRPFLLLAFEPMCLSLCLYCALLLGILYLFFGAFNLIFTNNYNFNLWQTGLSFLGIMIGMILTLLLNPLWEWNFRRLLRNHEVRTGSPGSEPEYRLPSAILGAPLVTIGLLWFGWTTIPSIHWIVPIIGSGVFGAGVFLIFIGVWTFLVDMYPLYAASALAANAFTRSLFAAAFPLFGNIMYEKVGYQWATFILAMISLVMLPFPFIFYRYGKWFRARSRYAGAR